MKKNLSINNCLSNELFRCSLLVLFLVCMLTAKPCLSDEEYVEKDKAVPKQGTQIIEEKKPVKEIKHLGNADNGYLLLVNVNKENNNVIVVFKTTRKLSKAAKDKARICIDFFNNKNMIIGGESMIVEDYKILAPEETRVVYFHLPVDAENYKVWLPDFK